MEHRLGIGPEQHSRGGFDVQPPQHVIACLIEDRPDQRGGRLLVGAGTVLTGAQAESAIRAGADFLVSPHFDPALVRLAQENGLPFVPGVMSPTEVASALAMGLRILKLFPAGSLGPGYVKDLLGPFADAKLLCTGGIKPADAPSYVRAGAVGVGLGSALLHMPDAEAGRWEPIARNARALLESVRAAKSAS